MHPQVFVLAVIYFCFVSGQMGLLFWLPSATENFKKFSSLHTGIVFTFPFIVGAIALLVVARHSDKTRERRKHAATPMALGGFFILLAVLLIPYSPSLALHLHHSQRRRRLRSHGARSERPFPRKPCPRKLLAPSWASSTPSATSAHTSLRSSSAISTKRLAIFISGFALLGVRLPSVGAALCLLLETGAESSPLPSSAAEWRIASSDNSNLDRTRADLTLLCCYAPGIIGSKYSCSRWLSSSVNTSPGESPFLPARARARPNPPPQSASPPCSFAGTPRRTIRSVPSWACGLASLPGSG